jgi:Putative auto-transporter adhesin, head GIN domain
MLSIISFSLCKVKPNKMKKLVFLLLAVSSLFACRVGSRKKGSGNIVTQQRSVGSFTGIAASDIVSVEIQNGDATLVEVEGDDNVVDDIYTTVRNGVLEIRFRSGFRRFTNVHAKVYVTAPIINTVTSSGVGSIKANGILRDVERIRFSLSGAGNITAEVDAPNIAAGISGVGSIKLSGRTQNYTASVSGPGHIKSFDLLTENATAEVSGVGSIHVHASIKLKAVVSGVGGVRYRGGAAVEQTVSGVGSVKRDE